MSRSARIESIDALKELRTFLCNLARKISGALDDADFEILHTLDWLKNDRNPYWKKELRIRKEKLAKAKLDLKRKQFLEKSPAGGHYYMDELKALSAAQNRYDEAEDKVKKVHSWIPKLEKESYNCRGALQGLSNFIHIDFPNKTAQIDQMICDLEAYVSASTPSTAQSDVSVRLSAAEQISPPPDATDNIQPAPTDMKQLCKDLRKKNPLKNLTSDLPSEKPPLNQFKNLNFSNEILKILKNSSKDTPSFSGSDKLLFDRSIENSDFIYLENLMPASDTQIKWYAGPVKPHAPADCSVCEISALIKRSPAMEQILSLPQAWLVVLKNNLVLAVFNADNKFLGPETPS
ncbi:MAG: hypothetical protein MUO22_04155 [Sedimentisphaerales bacterium]|nr:hypothetical protein [Sedimentisphaerales bacterium]